MVFYGPDYDIRMHLGNALVVHHKYDIILQLGQFPICIANVFWSYFLLLFLFSPSLSVILVLELFHDEGLYHIGSSPLICSVTFKLKLKNS